MGFLIAWRIVCSRASPGELKRTTADKPDLLQSTRRPSKSMDLALSCEVNRQVQRNRAILVHMKYSRSKQRVSTLVLALF